MNPDERRTLAVVSATFLVLAAGIVAVTGRIARPYVVAGPSMEPTLQAGDRVVVALAAYHSSDPSVGDVVLIRTPDRTTAVKRVAAISRTTPGASHASIWVLGDNPAESQDSRSYGAVSRDDVVGRVVWRYWPPSRAGSIETKPVASPGSGSRLPVR